MSRNLYSACLSALVLLAVLTAGAHAQQFQPFIDPNYFHPDLQFFAPAEAGEEYGGEPRLRTGWYGGYDRLYIYVSRPKGEQSNTEGDFTWGNRYDIGYMTEENHGWGFSAIHIDGPHKSDGYEVERLNRYLEPDTGGGGGGTGGGGTGGTTTSALRPVVDRNDGFTGERSYNLENSVNKGDLVGFDLNKTWRLEPLHNGSIIEPLVGFRYNKFRDLTRRDVYERFDDEGNLVPVLPTADVALDDATLERFTINEWGITNHMVGGQLGFRWYKKQSRWLLDSDFRAFAMQNFQGMYSQQLSETTLYDGAGTGSETTLILRDKNIRYDHDSEFVWGMEIRAQAAYEVTRDIALRGGMHLIDYANGVGRGNNFASNREDLLMVGFTFGLTVNR